MCKSFDFPVCTVPDECPGDRWTDSEYPNDSESKRRQQCL